MGLDLSPVNTGVCILTQNGVAWRFHTIERKMPPKSKRPNHVLAEESIRISRAISIAKEVINIIKVFKVSCVAIEGYSFSRNWQSHQIGEVAGVVKSQIVMACGMIPVPIGARTARSKVFGKVPGGTKKQDIFESIVELQGETKILPRNDHEADAFVVAFALYRMLAEGDIRRDTLNEGLAMQWRLASMGGEPPMPVDEARK